MSSIQGPSDPNIGRIHPQGAPPKKTSSHPQKENQGDSAQSRTSDASLEAFDVSGAVFGGDTAPESISQERISMGPVASSSSLTAADFAPIRSEAITLRDKISHLNTAASARSHSEIRTKNNQRFNFLIQTLNHLVNVTDPKMKPRDLGSQSALHNKLQQIDSFIEEHFNSRQEKELGDFFDFWELDLRKSADEIESTPREGDPLNVIPDHLTRINWEHRLQGDYSVPYDKFYDKVILGIFPEKEGDENFRNFITYLINPLGDKEITAYSWKLFVDLLGPMERLRDNVLAFKDHPGFVGNMSRVVAENMLKDYQATHPRGLGHSIIRFSRTKPGFLAMTFSTIDAKTNKPTYFHIIDDSWKSKGQAECISQYQSQLMDQGIEPLPLRISMGRILEDLPKPEARYTSMYQAVDDHTDIYSLFGAESPPPPPPPPKTETPVTASSNQTTAAQAPAQSTTRKTPKSTKVETPENVSSHTDEREIPTTRDELLRIFYFIHMSVTLNNSKIYKDDIVYLEKIVAKLHPLILNDSALLETVREMYREIRDHEIEIGFTIPIKPKPEK